MMSFLEQLPALQQRDPNAYAEIIASLGLPVSNSTGTDTGTTEQTGIPQLDVKGLIEAFRESSSLKSNNIANKLSAIYSTHYSNSQIY